MNSKFTCMGVWRSTAVSLLLSVGSFALVCESLAQSGHEGDWWYFGHNAGVHFTSSGPVADTNGQLFTQEGCASISDNQGNLLFYTDGGTVYDATHAVMNNGTGLLGNFSATQSAIVVPYPGQISKYFIFTVPITPTVGLRYSIVDMSLNGGLGSVDNITKNTLVVSGVGEKVTCAVHANGTDYWVLTTISGTNQVQAYHVSSSGVNPTAVTSTAPVTIPSVGYMKANPPGDKLAIGLYGSPGGVLLAEFDNLNGTLSNYVHASTAAFGSTVSIYGVEFAPNDSLLYVASSSIIYQLDISVWNVAAVSASTYNVASVVGYGLQIGPDGKIYSARYLQSFLNVINFPNIQGSGCGFVANAVPLLGKICRIGLPNFMPSFFSVSAEYDGHCLGDLTVFSIDSSNVDSVFWDFDDPASGTLNNSSLWEPTHVFTDTGTFLVNLVSYSGIVIDTTVIEVYIHPHQSIDLGPDTAMCAEAELTLSAYQPSVLSYLWYNNSNDSAITVMGDSEAWVTVFGVCDTVSDTININWYYPFILDLGPDTNKCTYDSDTIHTGLGDSTQVSFLWSTGNVQHFQPIGVTDTGTYSVTATDGACTYSDTIHVGMYPEVLVDLGNDSMFCHEPLVVLSPKYAQNAMSYLWSTQSNNVAINVIQSGTYTLQVSGQMGYCHATDSVHWDLLFEPTVSLGHDTLLCHNETMELKPVAHSSFPMTYLWNDNSTQQTKTINSAGLYWLEVKDQNCSIRDSIVVGWHPLLEVTLGEDVFSCEGRTETLTAESNRPIESLLWSDGSTDESLSVTAEGNYSVTVTDEQCSAKANANVFMLIPPAPNLGPDTAICPGDTLWVRAIQNNVKDFQYQWSTGSHSLYSELNPTLDSTIFWVSVSNKTCSATDSILITYRPIPAAQLGNDTSICEGDSITVGVADVEENYTYTWVTGSNEPRIIVSTSGLYTLRLSDGYCFGTEDIDIGFKPQPREDAIKINVPESICPGEMFDVELYDPLIKDYLWSDGSVGSGNTIKEEGQYWVRANHVCGTITDTVALVSCICPVYVPEAFHPNGDGTNEVFGPESDCAVTDIKFQVFNRWGEVLFSGSNLSDHWDGTAWGKEIPSGSYIWKLEYSEGNTEHRSLGQVMLIR